MTFLDSKREEFETHIENLDREEHELYKRLEAIEAERILTKSILATMSGKTPETETPRTRTKDPKAAEDEGKKFIPRPRGQRKKAKRQIMAILKDMGPEGELRQADFVKAQPADKRMSFNRAFNELVKEGKIKEVRKERQSSVYRRPIKAGLQGETAPTPRTAPKKSDVLSLHVGTVGPRQAEITRHRQGEVEVCRSTSQGTQRT